MMNKDEIFMSRCIQLAKNGKTNTPPNPMVGAVIVYKNRIIGEGYHIICGKAHAEVNAINSVKKQELLKESTLYVSLEPCSHYGKTPPCADLIIEKQIPRIVVGCIDPFSKVSGRGVQKLRDAGRSVKTGILENECLELNKQFMRANTAFRPYTILKWAESADGLIDGEREKGSPTLLSSPFTQMLVHKLRSETSAILVGTNTARLDNPSLTTRLWYGKSPIRLVIDRNLSLPPTLHLFDNSICTYVFTEIKRASTENLTYIETDFSKDLPTQILKFLQSIRIQSLIVEGGRTTLQGFIDSNMWDEIRIEKTKRNLEYGVSSPTIESGTLSKSTFFDNSTVEVYINKI